MMTQHQASLKLNADEAGADLELRLTIEIVIVSHGNWYKYCSEIVVTYLVSLRRSYSHLVKSFT